MKYVDAEKLKAEIDKLIDDAPSYDDSKAYLLKVLSLIVSLQQEQQEVYLNENTMEKEFRMIDSACLLFNYDKLSREQLIARRFYQLGLKAGKEER